MRTDLEIEQEADAEREKDRLRELPFPCSESLRGHLLDGTVSLLLSANTLCLVDGELRLPDDPDETQGHYPVSELELAALLNDPWGVLDKMRRLRGNCLHQEVDFDLLSGEFWYTQDAAQKVLDILELAAEKENEATGPVQTVRVTGEMVGWDTAIMAEDFEGRIWRVMVKDKTVFAPGLEIQVIRGDFPDWVYLRPPPSSGGEGKA